MFFYKAIRLRKFAILAWPSMLNKEVEIWSTRVIRLFMLIVAGTLAMSASAQTKTDNTHYQYFIITGSTYSALVDAINHQAKNGHYPNNEWHISWQFTTTPQKNGCHLSSPQVEKKITVYLPRWVDQQKASPALVAEWQRYEKAVLAHQHGHIKFADQCYQAVIKALSQVPPAKTCKALEEKANAIANQVVERYQTLNATYEKETKKGKTQGVYLNPVK